MMFMTPKISVNPLAMSAYTPPISRPSARACTSWVKGSLLGVRAGGAPGDPRRGPPGGASLPGRLLDHGVDRRRVLRGHDLDRAVLPLGQQELALRSARLVPGERPEDRLDLVGVQPLGHLRLVERADLL